MIVKRITNSSLFLKWTQWEYWPIWLAYLPVLPVVLYYVARTRRWFFFSNVNPLFKTGALMGASKFQILSQIPDRYKPVSIFISKETNGAETVMEAIDKAGLDFPIIAKPDVGERGILVALIENRMQLENYLKANQIDIIIQEYIDLPNECGIFYIRKPSEKKGRVVSVGIKCLLKLCGDGESSVRQLMDRNFHSRIQIARLENEGSSDLLEKVLDKDETLTIEHVGNHNRGATFLDGNHLISERLNTLFNEINGQMHEVYYGRFDVKFDTWEKLLDGTGLKILEMNGIASEPIHIYDRNVKIKDKYKSFYALWRSIYEISDIQKARGIQPISIITAFRAFKEYKSYMKSLNANWKQQSQANNLSLGL